MTITELAGAFAIKKLIEVAEREGWLDRLIDVFRTKHHVLVLGATGTGKTHFLDSLKSELSAAIDRLERTKITDRRPLRLDKQCFVFHDTPGDLAAGHERSRTIGDALREGLSGVLNIVAYGYHEYDYGGNEKARALTQSGNVREAWLDDHRAREVAMLGEWSEFLGNQASAGCWLITVVSKADLWWDAGDQAITHYQSGPYSSALGSANGLSPAVVPYCSKVQRFFGDGRVSKTFDDVMRSHLRQSLLQAIMSATARSQ